MSDGTKIEWTDATVNAVNGCSVVSPGCTNCYAMRLAGTRLKHTESRAGLTIDTKAGPVWNGITRLSKSALVQPLGWRRPRRIFWNAHGDLFHGSVPQKWIDWCVAVMALTPQHIHQVLTKRPERMREYFADPLVAGRVQSVVDDWETEDDCPFGDNHAPWVIDPWPLPNVWLGTSVEDQARADQRVPHLLATRAAVRFLSCEPLLGEVRLDRIHETFDDGLGHSWESCLNGRRFSPWADGDVEGCPKVDWVIVGGESGPGARPMDPDWVRSLRDQCARTATPFFFKQWGAWAPVDMLRQNGRERHRFASDCEVSRCGKSAAGRLLDGIEYSAMPAPT